MLSVHDTLPVRLPHGLPVPDALVRRSGGELCAVYELRYDDAPPLIAKIYADAWRWKQAKEVHVYGLIAEQGITSVPEVMHVDVEQGCTVLRLIPGVPMSELAGALTDTEIATAYARIGEFLAALHRIEQDGYGYLTTRVLDPFSSNRAYMTRQLRLVLSEYVDLGGDAVLRDAMADVVLSNTRVWSGCTGARLCHNDLHEGNVLLDRGNDGWLVTGFIDIENAVAADPLLDLAKTDCYSVREDAAKLSALLAGYGPLPDGWRRRFDLYRLYHTLELWTWYASTGRREPLPGLTDDLRRTTAMVSDNH